MGEPKLELTENMVNQPGKEILFAHFASNLLKSGELDEAIHVCEKGLKKHPTYASAHYVLARCYIRKKMNDEARVELERVLRYDPNHIKAIRDLAGIYFTNGFQDLYREYLMQLFTLDPMNEKVIQEAKKLGEFNLWSSVSEETATPEPEPEIELTLDSEPNIEYEEEKEIVFVEPEKQKAEPSETDKIFPDKIDLSQFDNVEDDFTTILHGKLEYSGKIKQSLSEIDEDLADVAKNLTEGQTVEDKATPSQNNVQSQPSLNDENASPGKSAEDGKPSDSLSEEDQGKTIEEGDRVSGSDIPGDLSPSSANISSGIDSDEEQMDDNMKDSDEFPDEEEGKFEQPKIISQTLGEILVSQQKYVEAKAVFEALKEKQPENKSLDLKIEYLDRIIGLEKKSKS
jgi:tetratricopeptide (TPR) repeat protein